MKASMSITPEQRMLHVSASTRAPITARPWLMRAADFTSERAQKRADAPGFLGFRILSLQIFCPGVRFSPGSHTPDVSTGHPMPHAQDTQRHMRETVLTILTH